jgi:hypothetical protein
VFVLQAIHHDVEKAHVRAETSRQANRKSFVIFCRDGPIAGNIEHTAGSDNKKYQRNSVMPTHNAVL